MCTKASVTCMSCQECRQPYCAGCLRLQPDCTWDIDFTCPPCIVTGLQQVGTRPLPSSGSPYLLQLAFDTLQSSSSRLALSTWRTYIRCVQKSVTFTSTHGVVCFPVLNHQIAKGCMLFFQHMRAQGMTWSSMRGFRSAFKSFHATLGMPDPWEMFPGLAALTQGLQKQISVPPRPKVGMTIVMLKAILDYCDEHIVKARKQGGHGLADVLLRDAVSLIIAFFAMRRSDEVFVNKDHSHGILQAHLLVVHNRHISLYIQAQKTDSTRKGHHITLAWTTGSGVKVGTSQWVLRLLSRLSECGVRAPHIPLFLPTMGNLGFRAVTKGHAVSKPQTFQRLLPKVFPLFQTRPFLLEMFGWHSCRRGGATHGFGHGVPVSLLAPHGGWNTEQGLSIYTSATFEQRMSVTLRM